MWSCGYDQDSNAHMQPDKNAERIVVAFTKCDLFASYHVFKYAGSASNAQSVKDDDVYAQSKWVPHSNWLVNTCTLNVEITKRKSF